MQIVIDISEGYYELLKCERERGEIYTPAEYEILKGIVLPKHGRLIDADELKKHDSYIDYDNVIYIDWIDEMPTIIEATKGE